MSIKDLEQQAKTEWEALLTERDKLTEFCKLDGYEDYSINPSVNWNTDVNIDIQHKTFCWTNFVTARIEKGQFSFSHGSGGWNDITVEEHLKATRDIFDIVQVLYDRTDEILEISKVISKASTIFEKTADKLNEARRIEALEIATNKLLETHRVISTDEIMAELNGGGQVYVSSIYCNSMGELETKVYENLVENRGNKRANYYFQNDSYKKDNLVGTLNNGTYFIAK